MAGTFAEAVYSIMKQGEAIQGMKGERNTETDHSKNSLEDTILSDLPLPFYNLQIITL